MRLLLTLLIPTISIAQAHFEYKSHVPTQALISELEKVYTTQIKDKNVSLVYVEGHTDSRGGESYNLKLSEARANSAAQELVKLGTDKSVIVTVGKGESKLLDIGDLESSHAKNRRIFIKVVSDEGTTETVISEDSKCEPKETVRVERPKHIVSVTFNRSISGYSVSRPNANTVRIENSYNYAPGLMYQNNVHRNWYIGVQGDINKSFGANIGVGF